MSFLNKDEQEFWSEVVLAELMDGLSIASAIDIADSAVFALRARMR